MTDAGEQIREATSPQHEVVESGAGTPTGAPSAQEQTEANRAYGDGPSRAGRDDATGVVGSEEGGEVSGGGGEGGHDAADGAERRFRHSGVGGAAGGSGSV
ncbi:MAG: hypothetical protein M3P96_04995 [Actinomycetota bacterium]|nr:hypothetical protein [Actinomycetota bacterium]